MHQFAHAIIRLLADAGWNPGRSIDISAPRDALAQRGITIVSHAARFIEEFDGLCVRTPRGPFNFSVADCLSYLASEEIPYLSKLTGQCLCPVGSGLFLVLLVAPNGDFILMDDHWRSYARFEAISDAFDVLFAPGSEKGKWIELGREYWPPGYRPVDSP
jgi:hypothetical protein